MVIFVSFQVACIQYSEQDVCEMLDADGIDLLNVSFEGSTAPDRISAIAGLAELERVSPSRRQTF